jgi:hypothetical protein
MEPFKKVKVEYEFRTFLPDHQALLSFDDDSDSYSFKQWWAAVGAVQFNQWLEEKGRKK